MLSKCLLVIFVSTVLGFPKRVRVGGLFDGDEEIQRIFSLSIKTVNKERHENEELSNVFLVPESHVVERDAFQVSEKVCELASTGVAGIFGPQDSVTTEHVQSMSDTMEMPHITARWDPEPVRGKAINLYPDADALSKVFYDIVKSYEWKIFAILYENTASLVRVHRLLKRFDSNDQYSVVLFRLNEGPNYRQVLKKIKDSEIEQIVVDCSYEILGQVLQQAQQIGIMSDKYSLIVTSLDLQANDLEPYRYSGQNFTGIRLVDPDNPTVQDIFQKHNVVEWGQEEVSKLRVESALMYDAVQVFARAFKQLKDAIKGDVKQLPCNGSQSWEHGISLSNFMRLSEMQGLTGLIKFDTAGFRTNFQLDIIKVNPDGVQKVGIYNTSTGIEWMPETRLPKTEAELTLQNKTFIVLISITHPYGMLKESASMMTGNERYEGFGIDIIQELSKILGFNYTFQVQADNIYGSLSKKTGQWNGMIRKLRDGEADLAITDLTITSERESGVDFTMPFMNLGISILYRRPTKTPPSLFSFLSPFSNDVWICLTGAFIFVSFLLFVVGRMCPAEWNNPYPCIEEPEELENQFTLRNSFWFTIGAIMQQGSEIAPIGTSTRLVAGSWWFFCLIMVSSYTANLAAFLTVETVVPPFSNVEDLAKLDGAIKYGAKRDGSTIAFFKDSTYPTYKMMYEYMQDNAKEVLTDSNEAGLAKVKTDDYAFLMESSSIEYIVERECNVTQVNGLLDAKSYGIAMKKRSPYRHALNTAVLRLQESGVITELKNRWWQEKRGGGKCREDGGGGQAEELGLDNVGGVFLVLFLGITISFFLTALELLWDICCTSMKENVPFKEEFMEEIKFIAKCSGSSKPVRRRKGSSNRSTENSTRGCSPPYGFVPTVIRSSPNDKE